MVASQLTDSSVAADRRLINAIPSVAIGFGVAFVCMFEYGLPNGRPFWRAIQCRCVMLMLMLHIS
jgi:hypothetical protein